MGCLPQATAPRQTPVRGRGCPWAPRQQHGPGCSLLPRRKATSYETRLRFLLIDQSVFSASVCPAPSVHAGKPGQVGPSGVPLLHGGIPATQGSGVGFSAGWARGSSGSCSEGSALAASEQEPPQQSDQRSGRQQGAAPSDTAPSLRGAGQPARPQLPAGTAGPCCHLAAMGRGPPRAPQKEETEARDSPCVTTP